MSTKKYLGIQIDEKLRRIIKARCAERGWTIHKAVLLGLGESLDIDVSEYIEDDDRTRTEDEISAARAM